jgi:hypothetical protein
MEITSVPVGAVDKITLSEDLAVYDGYEGENNVVGKVHKNDEYFVYKIIGDWYLIGNHQWIKIDKRETPTEEIIDLEIIEHVDESIEEVVEEITETHDEETNETTNLFKVIKKFFSKK